MPPFEDHTMLFSQRVGITKACKIVQRECMDNDLRNSLWSALTLLYWDNFSYNMYPDTYNVKKSNFSELIFSLWLNYFKIPVDRIPARWDELLPELRDYFFNSTWHQAYDFVEFIAENGSKFTKAKFIASCNRYMERENSAYRFVNSTIIEITSPQEIAEIETAISNSSPYAGVKTHLDTAISMLSSKTNRDYRNSIKESISAVESLAKQIDGDESGTLGAILNKLEKSKRLHPALKNAFSYLYGYTNDADGIRHALLDESNLTNADARFMLICCSAFINYAIDSIATAK